MTARLTSVRFDDLAGFAEDDHRQAFQCFLRSARALDERLQPTRAAQPPSSAMSNIAREAVREPVKDGEAAREFFERWFRPFCVDPGNRRTAGFVTGYYEPRLKGSLVSTSEFASPVLPRPADLVTFEQGELREGFDGLSAARRLPDGSLRPYPARAEIGAAWEQRHPILWLRDSVEVFLAQVQGSAIVDLPDGRRVRLAYDGRNGQPYTSIGRILIATGEISEDEMSLARLKQWLRDNGLAPGGAAKALMEQNRSYVFFKIQPDFDPDDGPIGGAGIGLSKLRSVAIDRAIWPYGALFWIDANLPWLNRAASPFRRLMIGQDTGSAIVGPARADIYFGQGDEAGRRAGAIRHPADFTVLMPAEDVA